MVSYCDLLEFAVRETERQQGGSVEGFGGGGANTTDAEGADQGYGERAGVEHRLLDIPARDVMNEPVATTGPTTGLDDAVGEMLDADYSSLVVEVPAEGVDGIVTLTDVLRSLTWTPDEDDGARLQVFGARYLTSMTREEVAEIIDAVEGKYDEMDVIEAYVILHKHKERQRGSPLIQATIRLFTDRGRFAGTGEEYGDAPAIRTARDNLERTVLDDKSRTMESRRGQRSPEDAERAQKNPRRVVRALEILRRTGKPPSSFGYTEPAYAVDEVVLIPDMDDLRPRIEARTERMFAAGIVAEVRALLDRYPEQPTAMQAIGYKEVVEHLRRRATLAEAKAAVTLATTQYAKRQRTWFRKEKDARRFEALAATVSNQLSEWLRT
jgi:ribosome-associated translation inhibitor RaiA